MFNSVINYKVNNLIEFDPIDYSTLSVEVAYEDFQLTYPTLSVELAYEDFQLTYSTFSIEIAIPTVY